LGQSSDDGAAGDLEISEDRGAGEGALVERSIRIKPGMPLAAGETLNDGVAGDSGAEGIGLGCGRYAFQTVKENEGRQKRSFMGNS